jgi:hypothetical protein
VFCPELAQVGAEGVVDRDVALEAADDRSFGFTFSGPAFGVGAGALAVAQSHDGDWVQSTVGITVAAGVEAMARDLA